MARPASARAAATVGRLTDDAQPQVGGVGLDRDTARAADDDRAGLGRGCSGSGMGLLLGVSGDGSRGRRKRPSGGVWCVEATHHLA